MTGYGVQIAVETGETDQALPKTSQTALVAGLGCEPVFVVSEKCSS